MKIAIQIAVVSLLLGLNAWALKANAAEKALTPGDWVTTTANSTTLTADSGAVAELPAGTDLVAGEKQGQRLSVTRIFHGAEVKGRVPLDSLRRLGKSGETIEERLDLYCSPMPPSRPNAVTGDH